MTTGKFPRQMNQQGETNLGRTERILSAAGGVLAAATLFGLTRKTTTRVPLAVGGSYLLYRGLTGKDPVYQAIGIVRSRRNGMEGIEVLQTVNINRPRSEVFAYWRSFENFPNFMSHVAAVQDLGDGRSRWVVEAPLDQTVEWTAEIISTQPDAHIAWRSLPDSVIQTEGQVDFEDMSDGSGTIVRVQLVYSAPGGSVGALLARLFGEEPSQQVRDDLRRFKMLMEAGSIATIYGQTSGRIKEVTRERASLGEGKGWAIR